MNPTKIIRSIYLKNPDYVPKGYYNYPELFRCISFDILTIKYSRRYMKIHIKPHDITITRKLCRKDRLLYPDGKVLAESLTRKNGKDLATVLNELDSFGPVPRMPWYKEILLKVTNFFRW